MIVLNPPFHSLKNATIEPIIIPEEKLQVLQAVWDNPKMPDLRKSYMMSRIAGHFLVCGNLPSHIAKYRMNGITKIEKYCNDCLERATNLK